MKKISGVLLLSASLLHSCKNDETTDNPPGLTFTAQNTGVQLTVENGKGIDGALYVNDKKVTNFNVSGENTLGDDYIHPGMNYLKLVSSKDTLTDSVFFSYKIDVQLVKEYPHDTANFTEGLFLDNNILYESTGMEGRSRVVRYQMGPQGFTPLNEVKNANDIFGEGIAISGNNLYQLTWKNHYVFQYDKTTLQRKGQFVYRNEGWGMTPDGDSLIASDGSPSLFFISPAKFEIGRSLEVKGENGPLKNINELELVGHIVVANVWQTNTIAFIDKNTGIVVATADLSAIASSAHQENPSGDVLNGIAYDPADGTFIVTGKNWTKLYRIRLDATWDKLRK